jgi:hypothetical protein
MIEGLLYTGIKSSVVIYSGLSTGIFLGGLVASLKYNECNYGKYKIKLFENSKYNIFCYSANKRLCEVDEKWCYPDPENKGKRLIPEQYNIKDFGIVPAKFPHRFRIAGNVKKISELFHESNQYDGTTKYVTLMNPDTGGHVYDNKVNNMLLCKINATEKANFIYHIGISENHIFDKHIGFSNWNYYITWLMIILTLRSRFMFLSIFLSWCLINDKYIIKEIDDSRIMFYVFFYILSLAYDR